MFAIPRRQTDCTRNGGLLTFDCEQEMGQLYEQTTFNSAQESNQELANNLVRRYNKQYTKMSFQFYLYTTLRESQYYAS